MRFSKAQAMLVGVILTLSGFSSQARPVLASGSKILVGDLVRGCKGEACGVEVAAAPLPRRGRVVRRAEVISALRQAGIPSRGVRLQSKWRVIRPGRRAGAEEMEGLIRRAVENVLPEGVIIDDLGKMNGVDVPLSSFEAVATWPDGEKFRRHVSVPVELVAGGEKFKTVRIMATFAYELDVPVAAADMDKGALLDSDSVVWKKIKITTRPEKMAHESKQIIGYRLLRRIKKGEVFLQRNLEKVPVILRGQRLHIELSIGAIRVIARGVARQDGAVGDRIRAEIHSLDRLLWVIVTDSGKATLAQ